MLPPWENALGIAKFYQDFAVIFSGLTASLGVFFLWGRRGSRSFAFMRVEAVESLPVWEAGSLTVLEDAAVNRALQNFFAAIESDDSLFVAEKAGGAPAGNMSGARAVHSGDLILRFRDVTCGNNRTLHFSLIEKLMELLKDAGSADSLAASLCLSADVAAGTRPAGLALRLRLEARGNSSEQAGLRWGLGLAQVQQALLFTSRYLRQQIARDAG
jgi:hypothetical protein